MCRTLVVFLVTAALAGAAAGKPIHVWEKQEITLQAEKAHANPYLEVEIWVELEGPGFQKRVYGFWDGERVFRVRIVATAPGTWSWVSGSNTQDPGLNGKKGEFTAVAWTEAEKAENICRRGFIQPTANGHALQHPDGTPFFLLADTWWSTPTFRYRWTEDDVSHPMGPEATFKDMVRFRKAQGYNGIAMIAGFPNWANDGKPATIRLNDAEKTLVRSAWGQPGTNSAKDMHNEGGRPFLFPGRVPGYEDLYPDVDRINPAYFHYLDQKIDYLNSQGFVPFVEVMRRDASPAWKEFYKWPDSYARYIQYVFSRLQANNVLLSPIHFDWYVDTIPARDFNDAANLVIKKYGPTPFGTLVSANSNPSTLVNFADGARWLTLHQSGNQRTHDFYWYLTEIFQAKPALPAIAGEPYYSGLRFKPGNTPPYIAQGGTQEDSLYNRSSLYGNFLSGGLGGYIYGADGIWQADIEPAASIKMWDAFLWQSGAQLKHLRSFAFSNGARFQSLAPDPDLVTPNRAHETLGFEGWAYCARTPEKDFFLIYLEKGCSQVTVRGMLPEARYEAKWFNPRNGEWANAGPGVLTSDVTGRMQVPAPPSGEDWGLRLLLAR